MIIRNFFNMIQHGWRWIVMVTLTAWVISLAISYHTVPQYRSNATFLIYPNANLVSSRDVVTSLDTLSGESVSGTYLEIFNSTRVFKDTIQKLQLDETLMDTYRVEAVVTGGSNISLSVSGPDPQTAAFLANNIGQNGINYIKSIYQVFDITFLDQASEPSEPYMPRTLQNGAIAAGIGLLVGILLVTLSEVARVPLEALRERAITDRSSSAYTRKHFVHLIEQEVARSPQAPLSLSLIHLRGLEDWVDALPEAVLSNLLRKVTDILHDQLRGNDEVGRWDRTTFSIFLPSTPATPALRTFERVLQALSEPIVVEATQAIQLNPAIGLATRAPEETVSVLSGHAQEALEKARQSNKIIAYQKED